MPAKRSHWKAVSISEIAFFSEPMMDRKQRVRQYKETPRPMGVYRITNIVTGRSLVASSNNLDANINRDKFQLKAGLHPNKLLQVDWSEFGPDAFTF